MVSLESMRAPQPQDLHSVATEKINPEETTKAPPGTPVATTRVSTEPGDIITSSSAHQDLVSAATPRQALPQVQDQQITLISTRARERASRPAIGTTSPSIALAGTKRSDVVTPNSRATQITSEQSTPLAAEAATAPHR